MILPCILINPDLIIKICLSSGFGLLGEVEEFLSEKAMTGLILKGARPDGPWLGQRKVDTVSGLVKEALDPDGRFPEI